MEFKPLIKRQMRICLLLLVCGVLVKDAPCQRRIIGGADATDGMFPFAAYLLMDRTASCTGSLLSDRWVLTAAHCVHGMKAVQVVAGAANMRSRQAQSRFGQQVFIHSKYVKDTMAAYDIALVKVDKPFNLSSPNISTIPLTSEEWPQNAQMSLPCKALGWGRISNSGKLPDILQYMDVVAKHGSAGCPCVKRFEQKKLVCLESLEGKGPCMGDSGGPLVCNGRVLGITHMGFTKEICNPVYPDRPKMACAKEDTVVTYFYLCPQLDWIRSHVPGVPATPASCSALVMALPDFVLILVLTVSFLFQ